MFARLAVTVTCRETTQNITATVNAGHATHSRRIDLARTVLGDTSEALIPLGARHHPRTAGNLPRDILNPILGSRTLVAARSA